MKKYFVLGMACVMAVTASLAVLAENKQPANLNESVCVESTSQGSGACTQPNCRCQKFDQRPGYYQCWCGHQRFSHK